jgi:prolactin regulatory element-binding protein
VLTEVKKAHGFSITSMAISPDRRILVSGSADNTCRVVDLPLQFAPGKTRPTKKNETQD